MPYHHLYLGEHAIRSARQGTERAVRPSAEIFGGWRLARESRAGGRVEGDERSPAAVERAEGDRRVEGGEGDRGEELGTGREGSVFISSRSFF